jgi:hypothetical protein
MSRRLLVVALLAGAAPALAMPEFVPKPAEVYEGYVALEMPRTELPIGALWVQDYGPSGESAAADNLVAERSLSQVTINRELQLGLTAGILNFFGLDPSYRNRLSARFGDLSIVRVKDMSKLSGPASEHRIYEGIRAGTITITTDNDVGLKLETRALGQTLPVVGRSDNGSRRNFSIDGRDMFIAFRVASQEEVRGAFEQLTLKKTEGGWASTISGRDFVIRTGSTCSGGSSQPGSKLPVTAQAESTPGHASSEPLAPTLSAAATQIAQTELSDNSDVRFLNMPLRVPVADGRGGLLDKAVVQVSHKLSKAGDDGPALCRSTATSIKASVQLVGRRLQAFRNPKAPRW